MQAKKQYRDDVNVEVYIGLDLDRGVGMKFHPLCGIELRRLTYDWQSRQFSFTFHFGGWCMEGRRVVYDRISGGGSWRVGEPYPSHWKFHPLTGKALKRSNAMTETVVTYGANQIDQGAFGAVCHPVTGERLMGLQYDAGRCQFFTDDHSPQTGLAWGGVTMEFPQKKRYLPRIGDGADWVGEVRYPSHWRFDPFTGQPLQPVSPHGLWEQE